MGDSVIDGIWESAGYIGESSIYDEEFLFFDSKFLFIQRDQRAIPVGVEYGTFEVRPDGKIDLDLEFDGMWNRNQTRDGTDNGPTQGLDLSINSDTAVIDGELKLARVEAPTSEQSIIGAWKVKGEDVSAANDTYLLFLAEGTVVSATPIDQLNYSDYTGLEFGTYQYSTTDQLLTINFQYDGAVLNSIDTGFSPLGTEFLAKPNGQSYELVSQENGKSFLIETLFEREVSVDDGIEGVWKSEGIIDETRVLKEEVLFFEDQFIFIQRDLTGLPVGVESGRYEVGSDGKLDMVLEFDGLWNTNRSRDGWDNGGTLLGLDLDVNETGSELVIDKAWTFSKTDFSNASSGIAGAWIIDGDDTQAEYDTYLVFFADGVVVTATPTTQVTYSTYKGLEIGSYVYSETNALLTVSIEFNGDTFNSADGGLSALGSSFSVQSSGENFILTDKNSDNSFPITKLFGESSVEPSAPVVEVVEDGNYSLTLIVDLLGQVLFLRDLEEIIDGDSHTVKYQGQSYDFGEIDPFVTTVARDNEFTNEFSMEIAEQYPSQSDVTYNVALGLIGTANWESVLISVAGADGNLVG